MTDMLAHIIGLVLSLVALALGPLLYKVGLRYEAVLSALRGLVLVAIGALVLVVVLPELIAAVGAGAVLALLGGLALPIVLERFGERLQDRAQSVVLGVALLGLLIHALLDGVALGVHREAHHLDLSLAAAVVLHRLPVGLVVWMLVRPGHGRGRAWGVLGLVMAATGAGFTLGLMELMPTSAWLAYVQAFVAGSLLHVLTHHHTSPPATASPTTTRHAPRWEALGAVIGGLLVWLLPHGDHGEGHHHEHAEHAEHAFALGEYGHRFLDLALETAPALLLGFLLAGLVRVLLPQAPTRWLQGGSSLSQAARGTLFGIPLPICSCGVVPLYQSLITSGSVPATAAMAFLVATPELGIEALLLSLPLLGGPLTLARLLAALLIALLVGWFVGRLVPSPAPTEARAPSAAPAASPAPDLTWPQRLKQALQFGFGELLDETAAWIVAGLAVAAAFEPGALSGWIALMPPGLDVVLLALVGMPLYICASGATPLAAALVLTGVSPGAALALLLAGPATNATTFGVLSRLHSKRVALTFAATVVFLAIAVGYLTNLVVSPDSVPFAAATDHHGHASPLPWICLALLTVAVLASIIRLGPSRFIAPVVQLIGGDDGDDCCGDEHGAATSCCGGGHEHGHDHRHGHDHSHDHGHGHDHESGCC